MENIIQSNVPKTNEDSEWKTKTRPKTNRKPKSTSPTNSFSSTDNEPYINYNQDHINLIKNYVTNKIKVLVIMRGPSGSGKSTLAKRLKPENQGTIISADNYFYNHTTKTYVFDKNKLADAHLDCKIKATNAMKNFESPVVVDNTNIKIWEFKPYVKLAVEYNYRIEIVEPNTPWKSNINQLNQKNKHNVDIPTIRRTLSDFEKVDIQKLIEECRIELKKQDENKKPKAPSGILSGFDSIKNNDWFMNDDSYQMSPSKSILTLNHDSKLSPDIKSNQSRPNFYLNDTFSVSKSTDITTTTESEYFDCKSKDNESQLSSNKSEDDLFKSFSLHESENSDLNMGLNKEIKESLNVLKTMFPDIKDDIILDFLLKYENDINMVTNILLDSLNFSSAQNAESTSKNNKTESENKEESLSKSKTVYEVKPLQVLCLIEMDKLEKDMENLNNRIKHAKSFKRNESISPINTQLESTPNNFQTNNPNCFCNQFENKTQTVDDEPIIFLKVNKLKCLVNLFGTPEELESFDENSEIPIDLDLGYKIYQSWKKTQKKRQKFSSDYSDYESQVESDEKLSLELFDSINMRDPIEKVPVYFHENGINSAQMSLRQIMAEEMAEQKRRERLINGLYKKSGNNLGFYESLTIKKKIDESSNQINLTKNSINNGNQSEYIANRIKLKHLFETYENLVDKKMIEEIFKQKNYNFQETTDHINKFFNFEQIKEPNRIFDIKSAKIKKKSLSANEMANNHGNLNRFFSVENQESEDIVEDGRILANKYSLIRQSFFEKAAEAHSRGWGAVAQYYADMGHEQTKNIEDSNKKAAIQIFKEHNPDINHSNTLDLHGLHVKEAINVLKNIINERKLDIQNSKNKKLKTYIFVITGYGHHSENGPKLRPNVINFLNQTGVRYREVHVGLLQVYLLSNQNFQ